MLAEVVQDACLLLECRQPLELCPAITPVQDAAALVPHLERFLGDVCSARAAVLSGGGALLVYARVSLRRAACACMRNCLHAVVWVSFHPCAALCTCAQAVFQRGLVHVPPELRHDNPADVPAVLLAWVAELG